MERSSQGKMNNHISNLLFHFLFFLFRLYACWRDLLINQFVFEAHSTWCPFAAVRSFAHSFIFGTFFFRIALIGRWRTRCLANQNRDDSFCVVSTRTHGKDVHETWSK